MEDTVFCGVFDGHGPFGHLVAKRVRDSLPSKLVAFWHDQLAFMKASKGIEDDQPGIGDSKRTDYGSNVSTTYESAMSDAEEFSSRELSKELSVTEPQPIVIEPPAMFGPWKESHLLAFKEMDQELRMHPAIDCFCSGTTTVTVLKQVCFHFHLQCKNPVESSRIQHTFMLNSIQKPAGSCVVCRI